MGIDIRLPIGGLFVLLGCMLAIYGAISDKAIYQRSLGININLAWGVVLLVFGVIMLLLGRRGTRNRIPGEPRAKDQSEKVAGGELP